MPRSGLDHDIEACMAARSVSGEGAVRGRFVFPASFRGFLGHFEGQPVLPGVCMIRAALLLLPEANAPAGCAELRRVVSAKWYRPVRPGEAIDFELRLGPNGTGPAPLRVQVTREGERIADLRLAVDVEGGAAG